MKTAWDYVIKNSGVKICRAWGTDPAPQVPECIEGLPVTEIGPYAFSESELPRRFRVDGIKRTETGDSLFEEDFSVRIAGGRVRAVTVPETVKAIGDYAFYGCTALSEIRFAGNIRRIGSGAFMGCGSMRHLEYRVTEETMPLKGLALMLSELRYAISVNIWQNGERYALMFPEYYESSVENVPARIIEMHFQGTGYRYRQCFRDGIMNYKDYDSLFKLAIRQEPAAVLTELAYDRLRFPEGASGEAAAEYKAWFSEKIRDAAAVLLKENDPEKMAFLAGVGAFDGLAEPEREPETKPEILEDNGGDFYMAAMGEDLVAQPEAGSEAENQKEQERRPALEVLLELAGKQGKTEIVSCLMDYQYKKQGGTKKKKMFEL